MTKLEKLELIENIMASKTMDDFLDSFNDDILKNYVKEEDNLTPLKMFCEDEIVSDLNKIGLKVVDKKGDEYKV